MLLLLLALFAALLSLSCEAATPLVFRLSGRGGTPPPRVSVRTFRRRAPYLRALGLFLGTAAALVLLFGDFAAPLHLSGFSLLVAWLTSLTLALLWLLLTAHPVGGGRLLVTSLAACLLLAVGAETVFNYRALSSHGFSPYDLSENLVRQPVCRRREGDTYTPYGDSLTFTYRELDLPLENLEVVAVAHAEDGTPLEITLSISANDEGSANTYTLGGRKITPGVPATAFHFLETAGKSQELILVLTAEDCETITVTGVRANVPKPFRFSLLRFLTVFLLLFIGYWIRPSSFLYKHRIGTRKWTEKAITLGVCLVLILGTVGIIGNGKYLGNNINAYHDQYQALARQLAVGEVTYPAEPPDFLKEMDNPYDTALRDELAAEAGEFYRWDTAYYEGNYYVYFGVVPVLLLYLPFYLLTGVDLPNDLAILAFSILYLISVFRLVRRAVGRHRPDLPFLSYLLLSVLLSVAGGLVPIITYPGLYCVPIMAGLALSVTGLSLLYGATEGERLSAWRLALAALCLALVAGCRPQMLLLSALSVPMLLRYVRDRSLLPTSKRGAVNFAAFLLPYALVAAGLMYYNAIRFSSPFDFGANYNLTTNDMTVRGFRFGRLGLAVWQYLLSLPKYTSTYPFIRFSDLDTDYLGKTIWEPTFGGVFAIAPFTLLVFLCLYRRYRVRLWRRGVLAPTLIAAAAGITIAIADAEMAGLLHRYFADFTFPLLFAALLVYLSLSGREGTLSARRWRTFLTVTLTLSLLHNATLLLDSYWIRLSPALPSLLEFWL
ncbi:MAG: hypothetical protein IKC73_07530 [Clostridia bacterium]|nr:hypothetical protein [Clostridia bacterium]